MSASLKRALQRKGARESLKRIRLDVLKAAFANPSEIPKSVVHVENVGGIHSVDTSDFVADSESDSCFTAYSDFATDQDLHTSQGNASNILPPLPCGISIIENDASDSDQSSNDCDDLSSDNNDKPAFKSEVEKEQYVIDSVREWAQEPGVLSMTKLDHLLHRLSVVFPNMPLTYTTLFACDYDFKISDFPTGGQLWYKGIRANLDQLDLSEYLSQHKQITLDVGIDGLPLNKRGIPSKLWPILGHLVGTENAPFIIAAFKGSHDPQDVESFMAEYVSEVKDLIANGYRFKDKVYKFAVRFYVLDAVGRQFIKCITSHGGYAGCEKCEAWGESYNSRLVFLDLDAPLRSDESFLLRSQPRHHKGVSPLEGCGAGMVSMFPLDPMHLVWGGSVKRLLEYWLFEIGVWKLHHEVIDLISGVFVFLRRFCPNDFNRKPNSLKYFKSFKCTEFRRIVLYDGILAFKDLVDDNIFKHFLLLHCSCYIMCSEKLYATHHETVVEMIRTFVSHSSTIYGKQFVVYCIHSLIHLPSQCDAGFTLDDVTAFKYENRLKSIKEALRSGLHPLQQLARRDSEKSSSVVRLSSKASHVTVSMKHKILNEVVQGQQYRRLKAGNFMLRVGNANGCFKTKDGSIVVLKNIICKQRKVHLVGCKFESLGDYYDYPLPSSQLGIFRVSSLSKEKVVYRLSDVDCKCYLMPDGNQFLCVPILHSSGLF